MERNTPDQQLAAIDPLTRAVRDLVSAANRNTARVARRLGRNPTDLAALYLLDAHGPMGATELAGQLGIRTASATALIDRLERAGHVRRARDPHDRRRITVHAEPGARERSRDEFLPTVLAIDAVACGLPAPERERIAAYLEQVTAILLGSPEP